jgi:hypothetical protein
MAITVADRFAVDLTRSGLAAVVPPLDPLVAGDDWTVRFQLRDDQDVAVSLTGYEIAMDIGGNNGAVFTRRTGQVIVGTAIPQIVADADQTTESGETGCGWFTVTFSDEDETLLLPFSGIRPFSIRLQFADGRVREFMAGSIEILRSLVPTPV